MTYLQASGLSKRFGAAPAVADVSFGVSEGEVLALLGPSGCGKTTLLRLLTGLAVPDSGAVELAGECLSGPGVFIPPERRRVGMVFQDWALFPHLSVADNVGYGLRRQDGHRIMEALDMVGLADLAERRPSELSGGQAQRVAVARALAPRPRVLLLDEPFSNLDTELRVKLRSDVAALMREVGMTAIFVTHDQEEAFVVGDRVAVMRSGSIVQQGRPAEVYEQPLTPWVASFVGETNLVDAVASDGIAATLVGDVGLKYPATGACRVAIRPEHLLIGNGSDGTVTGVEFYGHDTSYQVAVNGTSLLVRGIAAPRFGIGDRVSLTYSGPAPVAFTSDEVPAAP